MRIGDWSSDVCSSDLLLGACTNPWLLGAWRLLYAQNMRYRHMYMPLARFELELGPQHPDTMKVILARDVEAAEANAIAIYDKVTEFIENFLHENDKAGEKSTADAPARARRAPTTTAAANPKATKTAKTPRAKRTIRSKKTTPA